MQYYYVYDIAGGIKNAVTVKIYIMRIFICIVLPKSHYAELLLKNV